VKISLKSNLNLDEVDLETQSTTLGALLDELETSKKFAVFDSQRKEISSDCDVLLNGKSFQVLPDGLDTELRDGDKVEITMFMFMLGGG